MPALTDYDIPALAAQFQHWGAKPSHARRLLHTFYLAGGRIDPRCLKLGKAVMARLGHDLPLRQSRIAKRVDSTDGTTKLLIAFDGGGAVESVLMPAHDGKRAAGCISSQIGCAMRCDFCASTRGGLERDLSSGEIVEQFLHLRELAASGERRLATIVFMGMGEPMRNLDNVIAAIRRIASPEIGEFGGRQITVSTVGIVPGIDKLAEADLNVHLAISLHAPDDPTRQRLVPMNRRYPVAEIIAAGRRFEQKTGRIVTIEYCLLDGINDSDEQAGQLADLLRGFRADVNLIPYNPIGAGLSGAVYQSPPPHRVRRFLEILCGSGVVSHARRPRGTDVGAACGQLRETVPPVPSPAEGSAADRQ